MNEDLGIRIRGLKSIENSSGEIVETVEPWHPLTIFHPIPPDAEPTFDIGVMVDNPNDPGNLIDMSKLFAPLDLGDKITTGPTGIGTKYPAGHENAGQLVDAENMYAGMGTVPIPLELNTIPKGDFNCETYLFTYMDTSGSMNSVLPYARAAVEEMRKYFTGIYYPGSDGATLAAQYIRPHVNSSNEAWLAWFAGSSVAGQAPHNAVSIAFINESNWIYHPGHPTGAFNSHKTSFTTNYNNWINGGGNHHSAVMGLGANAWWSVQFSYHVLDAINNQGLGAMNVQGFMGLDAGGGTQYFVDLMVDWLNIPQIPSDLLTTVTAVDDQVHQTTVTWEIDDVICGKTGTYNPGKNDRIDYTMQGWRLQVATDSSGSNVVYTSSLSNIKPSSYTFTESGKRGAKYWLRATAVGTTGNADKHSGWVLCRMKNNPPVVTITGASTLTVNPYGSYTDPGWSATDDHDEESALTKITSYPAGFDPSDLSPAGTAPGTYTITYKAVDTSGAEGTATRTVVVPQATISITSVDELAGATTTTSWTGEGNLTYTVTNVPSNSNKIDPSNRIDFVWGQGTSSALIDAVSDLIEASVLGFTVHNNGNWSLSKRCSGFNSNPQWGGTWAICGGDYLQFAAGTAVFGTSSKGTYADGNIPQFTDAAEDAFPPSSPVIVDIPGLGATRITKISDTEAKLEPV